VNCPGGKEFYGRYFKCWISARHGAHGAVNLTKAIYQSCDVFFYTLGERLGISRIAKYAQAFGLGSRTGIDLPQEQSGVMPSEEWKIRNFKQKWYAGETISVSIGQGAIATTPIQLARAIGAIAMGGRVVRPHVAYPGELPAQYQKVAQTFNETETVPIDPKSWEIITDAMGQVVLPGGTAAASRIEGVDWGGKTGSAQVISNDARKKLTGQEFKDNGWFAGVTPRRNPEVVVATLIEQGEHGTLAAEVTSKVIRAYVAKKKRTTQTAQLAPNGKIEIAGVWTRPDGHSDQKGQAHNQEALQAGHFYVPLSVPRAAASAVVAVAMTSGASH
jgi:penicillin-binding protein 2